MKSITLFVCLVLAVSYAQAATLLVQQVLPPVVENAQKNVLTKIAEGPTAGGYETASSVDGSSSVSDARTSSSDDTNTSNVYSSDESENSSYRSSTDDNSNISSSDNNSNADDSLYLTAFTGPFNAGLRIRF